MSLTVPPAKLLSTSKGHVVPGKLHVQELTFQVPLDYNNPTGETITLFARRVNKHEVPIFTPEEPAPPQPYIVYLQGGPGFGCFAPQDMGMTSFLLQKGYQVLYLDHRGVGLSSPVDARTITSIPGGVEAQVKYMTLMRQDNTVRDCEAVRKCLTHDWPEHKQKWSILGQSYGGFCSLTYLSLYPEGLREVFNTGGVAPVGKKIEDAFEATFRRTTERNEAYYKKFPEDADRLRKIVKYIEDEGDIPLPAGGVLTVPRLLCMGFAFGSIGGNDRVHNAIVQLSLSLEQHGFLGRACLELIENWIPYDANVIFGLMLEACFCDGPGSSSRWAAERLGKEKEAYAWLNPGFKSASTTGPIYFSGEMVYPFFFEVYPELKKLREVAHGIAAYDQWTPLYDQEQLRKNEVPVYAAIFVDDMYVDGDLSRETVKLVKGIKVFETNMLYHTALRTHMPELMQALFSLREDTID